jgi:membrane protease YdiL (CAAX protease family)
MTTQATDSPHRAQSHTLAQSAALHLVPGALGGAFYFVVAPRVRELGYPSVMALALGAAVIVIPLELGCLLYEARKKCGTYTLAGVLLYRQRIPAWQYAVWIPVIIVTSGLLFAALTPVSTFLEKAFDWLPGGTALDMGLSGGYSKPILIATYLLYFVVVALAAPVVEELYFRGYLLPRMPSGLKAWTPIVHSLLFALYHVWTPWMIVARAIGALPLVYVVQRKRNVYLGIIAHCLVNTIDVVAAVMYIIGLS